MALLLKESKMNANEIRLFVLKATTALIVAFVFYATGGPAAADDAAPKVRITKKDCQRIVRHQARADVAYQPGVDVRGNPVVPADASGGFTIPLPDVFEFNITKDLTAYLDGPEEQLAADKAAAIAAERSVAATNAAVSSAETAVADAQSIYDDAAADATAAQTVAEAAQDAADAAPNNDALAAAAVEAASAATTAQAEADAAAAGLETTQTAYEATQTAATSDDVSGALTAAQAAQSAAEATATAAGLDEDAASTATADTSEAIAEAEQAATDSASADAAALEAAETVAKSAGMSLNIGTVRYNIKTGAMTFNGKPLNDASNAELAAQCEAMLNAK